MVARKNRKEKTVQEKRRVPSFGWDFPFLKELQLLTSSIRLMWLIAIKEFDVGKLFVSDTHDAHFPKLRQNGFHSFSVDFRILHTGTMPHIDGELKHRETVFLESLTKQVVFANVFLSAGRTSPRAT